MRLLKRLVQSSREKILTVCEAESPEAGDCHLGEEFVLSSPVVVWIGHLLLCEKPLVSRDGYGNYPQGY